MFGSKRLLARHLGLSLALGTMALSMGSCDEATAAAEELCGPCGSIAQGDITISGNAQLDGFFTAVATIDRASTRLKGEFDAEVLALADAFGVARGEVNADLVAEIKAAITAEVNANAEGGLQVEYQAPQCSASVDVAVEAQAKCEVQAGCEVEADPGQVSFACEGTCQGGCTGECTGELACAVEAPSATCEGQCEGACQLDAAATCSGTCRGSCDGTCSATDANGECAGRCDGQCTGTCELEARASCSGTCRGTCFVEPGSAQCTAEAQCSGQCSGECSGSCQGSATPPSVAAECEASADCQAQASAQASAAVQCTPPQLAVDFALNASANADARAAFIAKMEALRVHGVAILAAAANLEVLVNGQLNGEVVFDPAPLVEVQTSVQGLIDAGVTGELDIPTGRLPCAVNALPESVDTLGRLATDLGATLQIQADLVQFLTSDIG